MIAVDQDEKKYLCIVIDGSGEVVEGHRTVVSMQHEQGMELYRQLVEYYGRLEGVKLDRRKAGFFKRLFVGGADGLFKTI